MGYIYTTRDGDMMIWFIHQEQNVISINLFAVPVLITGEKMNAKSGGHTSNQSSP